MRLLFAFFVFTCAGFAQNPDTEPTTPKPVVPVLATKPIWRCNVPGGVYEMVVQAMVSVSSHEYIVDGVARVTEVNVDTQGSLTIRFYYLEPVVTAGPGGIGAASAGKMQALINEAADRTGTDAWRKVVKNYPTTTHSKTVEYRLGDKDALTKILHSASKSLRTGQADEVTIAP